jgi:sulfur-oxidizing protein SoxA
MIADRMRLATAAACAALAFGVSLALAQTKPDSRHSGYQDMGPALQKMQDDDSENPGMLWVLEGEALWGKPAGAAGKACADCHGATAASMKGVAARYPAISPPSATPVDLEGRINLCRVEHQKAEAFAPESRELLALTAFLGRHARDMPIAPPDDARLAPFTDKGEALFKQRQGQLNLSCAQCHDDNAGKRLGAAPIPQGHPTGYPVYRLEWQDMGSLKRRLRNCLIGMRAEPYAYDAPEYVELELYLMKRAAGMKLDAPGVRP